MRSRITTIIKSAFSQLLFYIMLIVIWQGIYYLGTTVFACWKPYAFPNPIGVFYSLLNLIAQNVFFNAVIFSLRRALIGYLISVGAGCALGLLLLRLERLRKAMKPMILGIQTLPSVCWVPFSILWFGLNESAIIFVIVMGSAFSIAIAVDMAIRSVNPIYVKAARTMGASGLNLYSRVILPAGLPSLITGLKQGWSFAWRSLMAGEVMTATIGLGQALTMGRDLADINRVMLIIIVIILLGSAIEKFVFGSIESRVLQRMGLA